MSESLEKMRSIDSLPLFPLPLVMLPNEILPLHIFEDRYRQMLSDIEVSHKKFGILYFEPQENFIDRPATGTVGCVAEIRDAETMPDGRSNIVTIGVVRFRLIEYIETREPYFVGNVEYFEDLATDDNETDMLADEVYDLFRRIAKAAFKMSGGRGSLPEIHRGEPEQLSFLVSAAFNFENELKYELLMMTSTAERLLRLRNILLRMVSTMEESADVHAVSKTNGHSKKKLDI